MTREWKTLVLAALLLWLGSAWSEITEEEELVHAPEIDTDAKTKELLLGDLFTLPHYYKNYGEKGKNFELDESSMPYIECEQYNKVECNSTVEQCTKKVRCIPERRTHQLSCMAVIVYNSSVLNEERDMDKILQEPTIKGCWSQDASELRECAAHDECVVDTRSTGSLESTVKFCCCRTHNCNRVLRYAAEDMVKIEQNNSSMNAENYQDMSQDYWKLAWLIIFTIVIIVCIVIILICIFVLRKRPLASNKNKDNLQQNGINMERLKPNRECMALIGNKMEDLRNIVLQEKISKGRFGEVFLGVISGRYLAVKLATAAELDSWINEQDIYAVNSIRAAENICEFVASFEFDHKYWLVTRFYQLGSLYDYLKQNKLSLIESARIISGFLNGLAFLHEERDGEKPTVVHRDFKSKNVLLKDNLTSCISDFGLAMKYDGNVLNGEDMHGQVGTRRYMSPEVLEGATEFSSFAFQQIDVYAAALVMWECLHRTIISDEDEAGPSMLPYEAEIGETPTLGQLREVVVILRRRPVVREEVRKDTIARKIVTTMEEMWEMEPDARITSGCARDRVAKVFKELTDKYQHEINMPENFPAERAVPLDFVMPISETVAAPDGDASTKLLEKPLPKSHY